MNILILEDEIPAYKKLHSYLKSSFEADIKHDWARSIAQGKEFLANNIYDVILSDIQLLDGVSFDLFDEIQTNTPIIFCSAYDNYLFKAFNTNGIAYILKPYTQEELNQAISKYQSLFNNGNYEVLNSQTISALKTVLNESNNTYKKRFIIKTPKGIQLVNTNDIALIKASGDFCIATDSSGKRHTISQNLGGIYSELNPQKFFKINRSEIINIDFITAIENHFKNRLLLSIKGSQEKVMTSSSTTAEFRKWLEN